MNNSNVDVVDVENLEDLETIVNENINNPILEFITDDNDNEEENDDDNDEEDDEEKYNSENDSEDEFTFNKTKDEVSKRSNLADVVDLENNKNNFLVDIIRYFDDLYVSGRTHIENNYFNLASNEDFNLVYPNIYIGNYSITTNLDLLKSLGITHIVSVIPSFNPAFEDKFKYLYIKAYDDEYQDMKQYFDTTNEFIKNCLIEGGKVLIHCLVGRSRSVTIFMAFLISIIKCQEQGKANSNIFLENIYDNNSNNSNDICNIIEYKKMLESKNKNKYKDENQNSNYKSMLHTYIDNEKITTIQQKMPKLSKKEEIFIIYKKKKMISDINEIICNYNILQKDLYNFKTTSIAEIVETEETNELFENMKKKYSAKIIEELLKYTKTYRNCASPNDNFIIQLCNTVF